MDNLEKELRELEGKCRDARNKLSDLDRETRRIFKDKIALQKDINSLTATKADLTEQVSHLSTKIKKADEIAKQGRLEVAKERAELDQERAKLSDAWIAVDEDRATLHKEKGKTFELNVQAKEAINKANSVEKSYRQSLASLKKKEEELTDKTREQEKLFIKFKKLEDTLRHKELRVVKETESVVSEKGIVERQRASLLEEQKRLADLNDLKAVELKELREKEAEIARKLLDAEKREEIIRSKSNDILSKENDLKRRTDELEVKRLRLESAMRDGELKKELARLKKEVEK